MVVPAFRPLFILVGGAGFWQLVIWITNVPGYILPSPLAVMEALLENYALLGYHAWYTLIEIILGLICGVLFGVITAVSMNLWRKLEPWLLPFLVVSQAIPVFALAPILVLWFGYGLTSKIMMAALIIFFPITAAFYDGLRQTDQGWLDLAKTMRASRLQTLRWIKIPAALPAFASGLRIAVSIAPIGAIVGEWVGSSAGLGYLMLHANARLQIDVMFAALFILATVAVFLYTLTDRSLNYFISWKNIHDS